jgi:hypothetical protein
MTAFLSINGSWDNSTRITCSFHKDRGPYLDMFITNWIPWNSYRRRRSWFWSMQYRLISQIPMHRLPKFSKTFLISGLKQENLSHFHWSGTWNVRSLRNIWRYYAFVKSIIRCAGTFEFHQLDARPFARYSLKFHAGQSTILSISFKIF